MTNDNPPPTPALTLSDKLMAMNHLTTFVPEKLDVDAMNYSSWVYYFSHLCHGYGILDHLVDPVASSSTTTPTDPPPKDAEWTKIDFIIRSWIFSTLAPSLRKRLVDLNPTTAKDAWTYIEAIFQDNKRPRAMALKAELRNLKLGDLSIDGYFQKIESIVLVLNGLGSPLSNDDVVTFVLEGLPSTYETISTVIVSWEPFPDLKIVRSLLTTHEMRLKSRVQNPLIDATSASPMVLLVHKVRVKLHFCRMHLIPQLFKNRPPIIGTWIQDFITRRVLLQCDSTGSEVLRRLVSSDSISCNKEKLPVLCHACQLGKHVKILFYYVLFLDQYSQYVWVYPLMNKSDVLSKFLLFRNYVRTQFKCEIKSFQCDQGGEFDNHAFHKLFNDNGIQFRFSCPRTSQQNGKSELYLLNILPSRAINNEIPFTRLFGAQPDYSVLRVFGCLCYSHIDTNHKLGPRATPSIFLRHVANHFGYHYLDLNTNKIVISCHVTFDETVFPFPSTKSITTPSYDFLDDSTDLISIIICTAPITPVPAPVHTLLVDVPTSPTPATPPTPPSPPTPQSVPQIIPEHAPAPTNDPPTMSIHLMVTRSRVGTTRPNPRYDGHVSTIAPLPRSYKEPFNDPNWRNAMFDEYNALIKNKT
ncbi:ribonuclease H-like domain-containing protein [Tanacetum coccineum]